MEIIESEMMPHPLEHMPSSHLCGIVLAAGKGTRMGFNTPKVLLPVSGKPMLGWVLDSLKQVVDAICVVVSDNIPDFKDILARHPEVGVCIQKERNGTAGAVASAAAFFEGITPPHFGTVQESCRPTVSPDGFLLVCAGDTPALSPKLLSEFVARCRNHQWEFAVLGMKLDNPHGYGRLLVKPAGLLDAIVEEKDATPEQKSIGLCNSGIYYGRVRLLFDLLGQVKNDNAQKEYYLTDCAGLANQQGVQVGIHITNNWQTLMGVNDPQQLNSMESYLKQQATTTWEI